ncbi:MAG: cytochrome c oxidase subunit 3 [Spirochaetota bacterium]
MSGNGSRSSGALGMWLFIATEILLFGGLFLLYSIYRLKNPSEFHSASLALSRFFGTLNTVILITSSFTVALSIHFMKVARTRLAAALLVATVLFALGFLVVKAIEWTAKFEHGIYPNAAALLARPRGEILYFGLYYMMTGLHAVHVIVGIGVLTFVLVWIARGKITAQRFVIHENAGLYWHLVDIIWIFLFPLFYLLT